jgi:hypothetical protein
MDEKSYINNRSVGIATDYRLNDRGVRVRVPVGLRIFTSSYRPDLPMQPPIQWVPGDLSPKVKWPGCEADHSPSTSAEVKRN